MAKRCGKQLQQPQQKQRSSNNQSSSRAAYSRSRAAGRPCGQVAKSCQELESCVFLTMVSEGTLGLVDYHCRAPFRPLVPWCFPVREVHFFKAICWLKDVVNAAGCRGGKQMQNAAKSCQELDLVFFNVS